MLGRGDAGGSSLASAVLVGLGSGGGGGVITTAAPLGCFLACAPSPAPFGERPPSRALLAGMALGLGSATLSCFPGGDGLVVDGNRAAGLGSVTAAGAGAACESGATAAGGLSCTRASTATAGWLGGAAGGGRGATSEVFATGGTETAATLELDLPKVSDKASPKLTRTAAPTASVQRPC